MFNLSSQIQHQGCDFLDIFSFVGISEIYWGYTLLWKEEEPHI